MRLTTADLRSLADRAIAAATEAGEMIARTRPTAIDDKTDGGSLASRIVTEVDRRSEDIIVGRLDATLERFGLGLLAEEREDDGGRLRAAYFWCIDPLDGTLPFVEGRPGYAVSIALVARDGTPVIGVIYDPVEATLFHAVAGGGAFRAGRPWEPPPPDADVLSVFADRSFVVGDNYHVVVGALDRIARDLGVGGVQVEAGSGAVMNACGVLARPPACYLKFPKPTGGGSLWDFAATACLFHEVGAVATDIVGAPLDLNRADATTMNHRGVLFATDETLAARLRALYSPVD